MVILGRAERGLAGHQLVLEARAVVAADRLPQRRQRWLPVGARDGGDLAGRPVGICADEATGELALERHHGQGMSQKRVVQVAREAVTSFRRHRHDGQLVPGLAQGAVRPLQDTDQRHWWRP